MKNMRLVIFKKKLLNEKGVTLLQALIGAGILSLVSLGVVQMLENARMAQRRINLLTTLNDIKLQMETLLRDQTAFNISMINNAAVQSIEPFLALSQGQKASESSATLSSPVKFIIYDSAGFPQYSLYGTSVSGTGRGFTEKGTPCETFNPNSGSGTDECPISYRILMAVDCPKTLPTNETSCVEPNLTIVARLMYNPSNASGRVLQRFSNVIAQVSGTTIPASPNGSNSGKYDIFMRRTPTTIGRTFAISSYVNPGGVFDATVIPSLTGSGFIGGGSCTTSVNWHPAVNSFGWTEDSDPHDLRNSGTSTRDFRFNEIGQYTCSLKAKAFDCDSAYFAIVESSVSSTIIAAATTNSPGYSESEARVDFTFNVAASSTNYSVVQKCSRPSAGNPSDPTLDSPEQLRLGFSEDELVHYAPISISCTKMDNAF
jgi:hypothetical protein